MGKYEDSQQFELIGLRSRFDNLPSPPFGFVGRKEEINRCLNALEQRGWGVIIYGEGGIGKTTLALEVANIARDREKFSAYAFASAQTLSFSSIGRTRRKNLAATSSDAFVREFARILNFE